MLDLISVKKTHILRYSKFSLYHISKGEPKLYKKPGQQLDMKMLERNQYPRFYIVRADETKVVKKLKTVWTVKMLKEAAAEGVDKVRDILRLIIDEAVTDPVDEKYVPLTETIEILMFGGKKNTGLVDLLVAMNNKSPVIIERSINVMAITANYCAFKNFNDNDTKRMTMCALLHDVGLARIDKGIVEAKERLSDEEFAQYKTHPQKGFEMIQPHKAFDESVMRTALEHHERMDGSGYGKGIGKISYEARFIGLIDCYEALKYHDKNFRKNLSPFDALNIIKKDVVQGKYDRDIFMDLCSCLIK